MEPPLAEDLVQQSLKAEPESVQQFAVASNLLIEAELEGLLLGVARTQRVLGILLLEVAAKELGIPKPDINLGVGSASHAVQTAEIMKAFEPVVIEHKPDAVLVVGSTVSVWPAADVVMRATQQMKPIVVINQGETDVDHIAAVKIDAGIGEVLPGLVERILG